MPDVDYGNAASFQSTLSMRRATRFRRRDMPVQALFQSTLSMRRATRVALPAEYRRTVFQSTLSMRRATSRSLFLRTSNLISIHALHEESDCTKELCDEIVWQFQSTLSMRRATDTTAMLSKLVEFQSTLSMRRATHLIGCGKHFT